MGEVTSERLDTLERYYVTRGRDEFAASLKVSTMQDLIAALRAEQAANATLRQRAEAAEAESEALRRALKTWARAHGAYFVATTEHGKADDESRALGAAEQAVIRELARPRPAYAAIAEARARVCEASAKRRDAEIAWRDHVDGRVQGRDTIVACMECGIHQLAPFKARECAEGTRLRHAARDAAHEVGEALDGLEKAESAQP